MRVSSGATLRNASLASRATAAFVAALFSLALGGVAANASQPDASAISGDFITLLTFVGGTPLTEPERRRVNGEIESQLRSDAAGVERAHEQVRKFLATLPRAQDWERAAQRENLRFGIELLPQSDPARQIVERHDPTVVFDRMNKRLVTEGTLAAWQRACAWMAAFLSVPAPDADFVARQRADLKASFAEWPSDKQDAIAHVERDYPVSVMVIDRADEGRRSTFKDRARPQALDRGQFGFRVADVMSHLYDDAVQRQIVNDSIVLGAGLNYNGLYHAGFSHM